jgi:hypothetical protein
VTVAAQQWRRRRDAAALAVVAALLSDDPGLTAARKHARPRGELLGRIEAWGLDVYEGSPPEWIDALMAEG